MVQEVTLPFGALNAIPGLAGIEDVTLRLTEPADVIDPVLEDVPTAEDIEQAVLEALLSTDAVDGLIEEFGDQLDPGEPLVQTIAEAVAAEVAEATLDIEDVVIPTPEETADAVAARIDLSDIGPIEIDIEGSLFDVEQDLIPLVEQVFEAADLSGLVPDLPLPEDLPRVVAAVVRLLDEFGDTLDEFVDDPLGTASRLFLALLRATAEEANLVSEDVLEEAEAAARRL